MPQVRVTAAKTTRAIYLSRLFTIVNRFAVSSAKIVRNMAKSKVFLS